MRTTIAHLVRSIAPYDALEREQRATALAWIDGGAPLFRVAKPDVPPQHLVAYFVLLDKRCRQMLLVDHKNAGLWLPNGGHVEPDEHPAASVRRELREELHMDAPFLHADPLFLTVTRTVGRTAGHTDVSLWYVLDGNCSHMPSFDADEFWSIKWFSFDQIPFERADPHLRRFIAKLDATLPSL